MSLRKGPVECACAVGAALLVAIPSSQANDESNPIVDIRFDAPYQQIESSQGDEWAPAWGRDDALYTANDDGLSFGGIPWSAIAFGKLEGSDPNRLRGVSISPMREFVETVELGPEGAEWNAIGSYATNGALFRFAPCASDTSQSGEACLVTSSDQGKSWVSNTTDKPVFSATTLHAPFFIALRKNVESEWGGEPGEYAYVAAYSGVIDGEDRYVVARAPAATLKRNDPADWSYQQSNETFSDNPAVAAAMPNSMGVGADGANWKAMNSYSVDGILYMSVTRCHYPWQSGDSKGRHVFENSSIIKSTDNGRTWVRSSKDNYESPMFPGKRFGTPYFVWYGKDGATAVDNGDLYIYAVSNNGHFENGDDYVLGRVLRERLPNLSPADWSFYRANDEADGMADVSWTSKLGDATPILSRPGQSSMTGMTYIEGLRRYVMVVWHYHRDNFDQAIKDHDLSTVLDFFEAPKPWGPWNKVKSFDTGRMGWFTPIIAQKFQVKVNPSTVKVVLYSAGLRTGPKGGLDMALYKLNYMPITLSSKMLKQKNSAFVGGS